jgi:hypothetical protein
MYTRSASAKSSTITRELQQDGLKRRKIQRALSAPAEIGVVTQVIWLKLQQSLKHINSSGVILHAVPAPHLRTNAALLKGQDLQSGT